MDMNASCLVYPVGEEEGENTYSVIDGTRADEKLPWLRASGEVTGVFLRGKISTQLASSQAQIQCTVCE